MLEETVTYYVQDVPCKGFLVVDNSTETPRPGIIIAHAWRGLDEFAKKKARELVQLGYAAFAADIYGNGKKAHSDEEAMELMSPLFLNRALLQERLQGAYQALQQCTLCNPAKIGAIGFCFGGLAVIELLRSGTPIKGAVSFHGVFGNKLGNQIANTQPIASEIQGSVLILHGNDDPLVTSEDIISLKNEFSNAKIDWQMHIYSETSHAFTNPIASDIEHGLVFNKRSAERSWIAMQDFFKELFY